MSDTKQIISLSQVEALVIKDSSEIYNRYPSLGHIFSCLQKIYTTSIETEAVGFDNKAETWTLYINPNDYLKYDPLHRKAIILHEIMHILLLHITRGKELWSKEVMEKQADMKHLSNAAADCLVNKLIEDTIGIPYTEMFPRDSTYALWNLDPETGETLETLYERMKLLPKRPQNSSDKKHIKWDGTPNSTDQAKELAKQKLREIVESARTASEGFGDLPAAIRGLITKALKAKVNLTKELMVEGMGSIKSHKVLTHKRPNRRHGFPLPGKKSLRKGKVLVGVDVSGSVSTTYKQKFLDIISKMASQVDVEMVAFDVQVVQHIKNWKREPIGIKDTGGGTDPQCVFDVAKKARHNEKPAKIFILTDGEFGRISTFGFNTVFVLTPGGSVRGEGKNLRFE